MSEADVALGQAERLHPLSLLGGLFRSLREMWGAFAAGGYLAVQGQWQLAVAGLMLFALFSLGMAFLRWRNFAFQVGSREIRIDSGLLSRTHRSIPFDRIQDVTVEQSPLARLFGLARVGFETGSAGAKEDEGSLAAIPLERAAEIRDLVRASRGLAPTAARSEAATEEMPIFAMDLKRVLTAGVFNFSLAVVGGLLGLSQTMGDALGFDPFSRKFWEGVFTPGAPYADFLLANRLAVALAGAATLILIGLATGIIRTVLRDYRFRLDRSETGLRRRRGLFTLTDVTLPARRTQAAIIASGPVRARFGWSELKLQSLAKEEGGKGDHVVAPLARDEELETVLDAIGWQPPGQVDWQRVSKAYVLAFAALLVPLLIAAIITLLFEPAVGFAALVALPLLIATRFMAWRRYGYALNGDRLLVRSGWWRRRIKILPLRNIQSMDYQQIFIDRWFGTASLVIGVAGGGLTGHGIKALPVESARQLRDQLLSRFA